MKKTVMRCRIVLAWMTLAALACDNGRAATAKYPGTEEGAKQLLTDLRIGANARELTWALKPSRADYEAVFVGDAAAVAESGYEKVWGGFWSGGSPIVIEAEPGQTRVVVFSANSDDIRQRSRAAMAHLPGGYKRIADKLEPGLTVYSWKYVAPGERHGISYDGLIHVNGHWAWFPKPWRAFSDK